MLSQFSRFSQISLQLLQLVEVFGVVVVDLASVIPFILLVFVRANVIVSQLKAFIYEFSRCAHAAYALCSNAQPNARCSRISRPFPY